MYRETFETIENSLSAIDSIKLVEWYLEQDNQNGGIVNAPAVLIRFEPIVVTQIAKAKEQADVAFDLLIYTDFMKGNNKVHKSTNSHFDVIDQILTAMIGFERTGETPIERKVGMLYSSMSFICRQTVNIPLPNQTTINTQNITPEVDTAWDNNA